MRPACVADGGFAQRKKGRIGPPRQSTTSNYWLIEPPILSPPFSIFTLMTWMEFLSAYT